MKGTELKVQKTNPRHWGYLLLSGLNLVGGSLSRPFRPLQEKMSVVLYGHTFNGNLKALADFAKDSEVQFYFATIDPDYYRDLSDDTSLSAIPLNLLNPSDAKRAASADAIITDRKAHTLEILKGLTKIPFIDVWHGMPYKGFTARTFRYLRGYKEVWVSSDSCGEIYKSKFQVPPEKIVTTGYARVDPLIKGECDTKAIRDKYSIENRFEKIVLIAPTWQQDDQGRDVVPFGASHEEFFSTLNDVGKLTGSLLIFRAHLNVDTADSFPTLEFVRNMPYARYPVVEEFLAISDVLVTDWSSLAFDYLPLRRPTIFLDVPAPFKDGFTISPEHRFGDVVDSLSTFRSALISNLTEPTNFETIYGRQMDVTQELIYGDTLDGQTRRRQLDRLRRLRDVSG